VKKIKNWVLALGILGCVAYGGVALRTPVAKADTQPLESALLTSILTQLIQIDYDLKERPACGCSTGQGAGQPDVWQ
jgi:hypothetical protein